MRIIYLSLFITESQTMSNSYGQDSRYRLAVILIISALVVYSLFAQSIISELNRRVSVLESSKLRGNAADNLDTHENAISKYLKMKSPRNMPSILLTASEEEAAAKKRTIYGGKGDKLHLGGFVEFDKMGVSENLWNFMLGPLTVKSVGNNYCP